MRGDISAEAEIEDQDGDDAVDTRALASLFLAFDNALRTRPNYRALLASEKLSFPVQMEDPPAPTPYEKLDVRVGQIVEAWEYPDSEKLWCEKIDLNETEGPRQICSGIREWYKTKEELEGKKVLVVTNLKAAKLGGVESNGMVLCASSEGKGTVAFVEPPETAALGERVLVEGAEPLVPASPNNMGKKKWMQKAAEDLKAEGTIATYMGKPLVVGGGNCVSPAVSEGTIS
jgi:methionine--tRNA ligase beta chain